MKAAEKVKATYKPKRKGTVPAVTPPPSAAFPTPSTGGQGHEQPGNSSDEEDGEHDFFDAAGDLEDAAEVLDIAQDPPPQPPIMVDYDMENGEDGKDASADAKQIKIDFDRKDVRSWFQRLEIRLKFAGVKSQWLKRLCLENILPGDIAHSCKEFFCKTKTEATAAGVNIYKDCKDRIIKTYGPKPGEDFRRALTIVMAGLPSEAAEDIRDAVCKKKKKFDGCCCVTTVGAIWQNILPAQIRTSIANIDIETDFDKAIESADLVYNAMKVGSQSSAVAATVPASTGATNKKPAGTSATPAKRADLDTSADAPAFDQINQLTEQLAAFNKNFKKKKFNAPNNSRGQSRGNGRGGAGKPQARQREGGGRGNPHPDGPPDNACGIHWRFGKSAYYCLDSEKCPWSAFISSPK